MLMRIQSKCKHIRYVDVLLASLIQRRTSKDDFKPLVFTACQLQMKVQRVINFFCVRQIPRSKWSCFNCQSKSPKKRSIRKSNTTSTPVTPAAISNGRPSTDTPPKAATPISVPVTPSEGSVEEQSPCKKPVEEPDTVASPEQNSEPVQAPR